MKRVFHRLKDGVATLAIFAVLLGLIALLYDYAELSHHGRAMVSDGDSLVLNGERIRLAGIDAPEMQQQCRRDGVSYACGQKAWAHLKALIAGRAVDCQSKGRDIYDRLLAQCSAGALELNYQMVADGWAIDYGGYADAEALARGQKIGLWAGGFEMPEDYRKSQAIEGQEPSILAVYFARIGRRGLQLGQWLVDSGANLWE